MSLTIGFFVVILQQSCIVYLDILFLHIFCSFRYIRFEIIWYKLSIFAMPYPLHPDFSLLLFLPNSTKCHYHSFISSSYHSPPFPYTTTPDLEGQHNDNVAPAATRSYRTKINLMIY